jgi:perosamine synthetase
VPTQTKFDIPIAKPWFTGDEAEALRRILLSGWVTQGPVIKQFETAFCEYVRAPYAVANSNCTTSLHLSMLIHGIGPGDEVLCPSYSFVATANGITHSGAKPEFIDVDADTLNIDPQLAEKHIQANYDGNLRNKQTGGHLKAILIVHQIGIPADIDAFNAIGDKYGIAIIEDAACGIGSIYKGTKIGGSRNVCAFSFHPRKVITTGEGGMVTTADSDLADKAAVLRAHGASISDYARYKSASTTFEAYDVVGYNYRMTDIQASLGISQLQQLEKFVELRQSVGKRFDAAFGKLPGLAIVSPKSYVSRWNYQSYPIRFVGKDAAFRDSAMVALENAGIATRRGIPPIHKFAIYDKGITLPISEELSETSLFLPIFPQMTDEEVQHVIDQVSRLV